MIYPYPGAGQQVQQQTTPQNPQQQQHLPQAAQPQQPAAAPQTAPQPQQTTTTVSSAQATPQQPAQQQDYYEDMQAHYQYQQLYPGYGRSSSVTAQPPAQSYGSVYYQSPSRASTSQQVNQAAYYQGYPQYMYGGVQSSMPVPAATLNSAMGSAAAVAASGMGPATSAVTTANIHRSVLKPKITTTMWEDEKTLCYQVEANGMIVVRRADNDMINGTKLLNVTKMTRGRRDGILKAEKVRHVVKIGSLHLKGIWIPFDRALAMARREGIYDLLYPLFVKDIARLIQQGTPVSTAPLPVTSPNMASSQALSYSTYKAPQQLPQQPPRQQYYYPFYGQQAQQTQQQTQQTQQQQPQQQQPPQSLQPPYYSSSPYYSQPYKTDAKPTGAVNDKKTSPAASHEE